MSYDIMRVELIGKLQDNFPADSVEGIMNIIDSVAGGYEIKKQETALTVVEGVPDVVKLYISAKACENLSQRTLEGYYRNLARFFQTVRKSYKDITTNDVRVYLFQYKQTRNVGGSMLNWIRMSLMGFFDWLIGEELIKTNPVRKIGVIKAEQPNRHSMTMLELEKLRSLCKDRKEKAIIDFMYSTGCRVSEMCNVKLTDVNLQEKTVNITKAKGGKNRVTYLNAEAVVSITDYLNTRKEQSEYLFTSFRGGRQMCKRSVEDWLKKLTERAPGYFQTHITPHVFRHTAATTALRNGMPLEQVQRFLGHAKISTTQIYASTDDSSVKLNHQKCVS